MNDNPSPDRPLVISYLTLRKAIGILGIALPFLVYLGALILFQTQLQESISDYYHTGMRDVFVGILFAYGIFLFSYKGYEAIDNIVGNLGSGFAIGVALFPTAPASEATSQALLFGRIHTLFAIFFFATLAFFSLFLFVKSDQPEPLPKKKQQRNRVYRICGWTIVVCMLGILLEFLVPTAVAWLGRSPVFWLETAAILAFGVSWFTKGEAIAFLNDVELSAK